MTEVDILRREVLHKLANVRKVGPGRYRASCPVPGHGQGRGDRDPSLSVDAGDRVEVVFTCRAGCGQLAVRDALITCGVNWDLANRSREGRPRRADTWMPCGHDRVAEYPYPDQDGVLRYGKWRCSHKNLGCKQAMVFWHPDATSPTGRRLGGVKVPDPDGDMTRLKLPYRLPQVLDAIGRGLAVWCVEGERDADTLAARGIVGTCNDDGAGHWTADHARWLTGADVVVVADRDPAGWAHAEKVVATLLPVARSIEVVRAAEGKDATDHFSAGLGVHRFVQLAMPLPAPTHVEGCPDCEQEAAA